MTNSFSYIAIRCFSNSVFLVSLLIAVQPISAQDNSRLHGEILLNDKMDSSRWESESGLTGEITLEHAEKEVDPYQASQDSTIAYFMGLEADMSKIAAGKLRRMEALTNEQLRYLAGVNLFCSSRKGVCPFILDSILEIDLINARLSKQAECPNMLNFWKIWTQNNFEKRHGYNVQTGHIKVRDSFRKERMPGYIRCRETIAVEGQLSTQSGLSTPDAKFFAERYAEGSLKREAVIKTINLTKFIRKKIPNIYRAMGIQ